MGTISSRGGTSCLRLGQNWFGVPCKLGGWHSMPSRSFGEGLECRIAGTTKACVCDVVKRRHQRRIVDASKARLGLFFQLQHIVPLTDGVLRLLQFLDKGI